MNIMHTLRTCVSSQAHVVWLVPHHFLQVPWQFISNFQSLKGFNLITKGKSQLSFFVYKLVTAI